MTIERAIEVASKLLLQRGRVNAYLSTEEAWAIANLRDFAAKQFGDPTTDAYNEDLRNSGESPERKRGA